MHDGGAHLALDVVAHHGHTGVGEALAPLRVGGDEHRNGVDKGHAGLEAAFGVIALGFLGAHRQIRDEHIGSGLSQGLSHVHLCGRRLLALGPVELAESVQGGGSLHPHPQLGHIAELHGVVGGCADGLS